MTNWLIRRPGLLYVFLPVFSCGIAVCLMTRKSWYGDDLSALETTLSSLTLSGPLVAAAACWFVGLARTISPLTATHSRLPALLGMRCLNVWLWAGLAFCAASACGLGLNLTTKHGGSVSLLVIFNGLSYLLFCAAFGTLFAQGALHILKPIVAGISTFGLGLAGAVGWIPNIFRVGNKGGMLVGLEVTPRFLTGQSFFFCGIALLILAWTLLPRLAAPKKLWFPAVSATAIGLTVAMVAFHTWSPVSDSPYQASHERPNVCSNTVPALCVYPSSARLLPQATAVADPYLKKLRASGLAIPTRYEQLGPFYTPPKGSGFMTIGLTTTRDGAPLIDAQQVVSWLSTPAYCPAWRGDSAPEGLLADQDKVRGWLASSRPTPTAKERAAFNSLLTCHA